jgi:hypothetical protein
VTPPANAGGKTLVLSGVAGERTEALKDKMRLEADFVTTPPASLSPYKLIILTDYEASASKAEIGLKYQYSGSGRENPLYLRNIAVKAEGDNKSILGADTAALKEFRFQNRGQQTVGEKVGEGPYPWSFNLWNANSLGEWALEKDPVTKQNVIALRNLEGEPALQLYNWQKMGLQPGTTYEVSFDYMANGTGKFFVEGSGFENQAFDLGASPRQWKKFTTKISVPGGPVPPVDFGPKLRAWVNNGGTLLAQNVTAPLQKWLETSLNVPFTRTRMEAVRAHKIAHDPLLNGISDGDLAWRGHSGEWAFYNNGPSEHDIIREEVIPEGARVLTYPAVLAKKPIGKGQLIVDQSRWAEVTNKGGEEWGLDSRMIAARLQTGLLMNMGAYFNYPEIKPSNLIGLSFEPLNIEKYLNRSRLDETAGDGKGWIDLGNRFDLDPLQPGVQGMSGVPFAIADEAKTGGNGALMLRSGEQFKTLPEESAIIPVGKRARSLFFLHTSAYLGSKKGTTSWEYEIRYEGHSKLIPGSNFAPFTAIVPVQAEVDVADWLGRPLIPAAWSFKHTEGSMNLYMQRWDNPRPDTPIESIVARSRGQKEVPIVLGITLANDAKNLINGDFAKAAPFSVRLKNFDVLEKQGDLPAGWSANAWHNSSIAQVFSSKEPSTGENALGLRNIEGRASLQFYLNPGVPIQAGKTYSVAFKYLATGNTEGVFFFQPKDVKVKTDIPAETEIALTKTGNAWKQFNGTFTVTEGNGTLGLNFQNRSPGKDEVLYLRDVMVTED